MHVPIAEAINSGAWFKCKCETIYSEPEFVEFRFKVLDFYKVELADIDEFEESEIDVDFSQGDLWILKAEIVNLNKAEFSASSIIGEFKVVDDDEFEFSNTQDIHICRDSQYAKQHDLSKFMIWHFVPKIKYKGGILFYLPREDDARYSVSVSGSMEEV